jgi:hypothetical protein
VVVVIVQKKSPEFLGVSTRKSKFAFFSNLILKLESFFQTITTTTNRALLQKQKEF